MIVPVAWERRELLLLIEVILVVILEVLSVIRVALALFSGANGLGSRAGSIYTGPFREIVDVGFLYGVALSPFRRSDRIVIIEEEHVRLRRINTIQLSPMVTGVTMAFSEEEN
jgi:hypothetical protein